MNGLLDKALRLARKIYPAKYQFRGQLDVAYTDTFRQEDSDIIRQALLSDQPAMIARFGSIEMNCLINYINQKTSFAKYKNFVTGKAPYYKWEDSTLDSMCINAGFFPREPELLSSFCELMLKDMCEIDVLGSWLKEEGFFDTQLKNATKVGLLNLEPYNHKEPWSEILEGKTVLVVHPYDESIKRQYQKRELLFADQRVLPEFNLKTIKAVQSISHNSTSFSNWFDALHYMQAQISAVEFDVAIIGCGAYGMPIAAFVKRMGKKAVHLGGATQLLFGIKGKRWEEEYPDYKTRLMNQYWTRPLETEKPNNFQKVENGCYW